MTTEKNTNPMQVKSHRLSLNERSDFSVDGVEEVESFSDSEIVLITSMGKLSIKGEKLHIEKLNVDTGEFASTGMVSSLIYSRASAKKGSFIERLFK